MFLNGDFQVELISSARDSANSLSFPFVLMTHIPKLVCILTQNNLFLESALEKKNSL